MGRILIFGTILVLLIGLAGYAIISNPQKGSRTTNFHRGYSP